MFFEMLDSQADTITVSIGKKYLYSIINFFIEEKERENIYKEIDIFINTITDKKVIYDFKLDYKLYKYLKNKDNIEELAYSLRGLEDEFQYSYLFYHMIKVYSCFLKDKKGRNIHHWFILEAKEPDIYLSLDDTLPDYDSILCKLKLKKFIKYTNRNKTSAEAWEYQLCLLYLIVINKLYKLLEPYIDNIEDFLVRCFTLINPIITGFKITLNYDLDRIKAVDLIQELMQLHSDGKYLTIYQNKNKHYVEFTYNSKRDSFSFSTDKNYKPKYKTDKDGNRLIKLLVSGKDNILNLKIEAVGLNSIEDTTDLAVDKVLFDLITHEGSLDVISYGVLRKILSHTREFKSLYEKASKTVEKGYIKGYFKTIFDKPEDKDEIIKNNSRNLAINKSFMDIEQKNLLTVSENFIKNFNLKKNKMFYITLASGLFKRDDREISAYINKLGTKQQALIRKMIKYFREAQETFSDLNILNLVFRKVCYKP